MVLYGVRVWMWIFHCCGGCCRVFLSLASLVLSSPSVRRLPPHNHVMGVFLLKKTAGHLFLHFNGVTFSTDIMEEGVSAVVLVETEQERTHPLS